MDSRKSLECAFELARSGKCLNITEIIKRLKEERLEPEYIVGKGLRNQLIQLIKDAQAARQPPARKP